MQLLLQGCLLLLMLCIAHCKAASLPKMATQRRYTESSKLRGGVSTQPPPLQVGVVSWNMAEKAPTDDACSFIKLHQNDDIVVFGIQECEDIRPRRNEGHRSRKWRSLQSRLLGRSFRCMARHKMGGLLIAVYVKKSVVKEVEGLHVADVACGVGNVLSNKGAVSVVLRIRGKTVTFINSHLAAHQKNVKKRNADYDRIMEVVLESIDPEWKSEEASYKRRLDDTNNPTYTSSSEKPLKVGRKLSPLKQVTSRFPAQTKKAYKSDISTAFSNHPALSLLEKKSTRKSDIPLDAVLFFGDLNYRVEQPRAVIERLHSQIVKSAAGHKRSTESRHPVTSVSSLSATRSQGLNNNKTVHQHEYFTHTAPAERVLLEKKLDRLLRFDQLNQQRRFGKVLQGFQEGNIRFPPTYKYDKGADRFDTSEKRRCPAWTDRILYFSRPIVPPTAQSSSQSSTVLNSGQKVSAGLTDTSESLGDLPRATETVTSRKEMENGKENEQDGDTLQTASKELVELVDYYSVDARTSDHRPVCATFRLHL